MKCEEVHQHFNEFLSDSMSVNDTDEFVRHVEQCADCRDELEVFYLVRAAGGELSDEDMVNLNVRGILQEKLEERRKWVRNHQIYRLLFAALTVLLLIAAVYVLFFVF